MDKKEVAALLKEIALFMEIQEEEPFRAQSYQRAARALDNSEEDLDTLIQENKLQTLPGIGDNLEKKIKEIYFSGTHPLYEELKGQVPEGLLEILKIPGLGVKKVKVLYKELGISNLGELAYACEENRLLEIPGFGKKTQEKILEGIETLLHYQKSFLLLTAREVLERVQKDLLSYDRVENCVATGSVRRWCDIVHDLDILVSGISAEDLIPLLIEMETIEETELVNARLVIGKTPEGIPIDFHIGDKKSWGSWLVATTGNSLHLGLIQETGGDPAPVLDLRDGKAPQPPLQSEEEFYQHYSLPFIPPELREGFKEKEFFQNKSAPRLIEPGDIKGIFHVHTTFSDGAATLKKVVEECHRLGWEFVGISDHSQSAFYANGLEKKDLERQAEELANLNKKTGEEITLFHGVECDILPDGSLDYPDSVLDELNLDFIIASVHSNFRMSKVDMTKRIIKALQHPRVTMLGHPTGRLLLAREAYPLDLEEIIKVAVEQEVVLEINSNPYRLDLSWEWANYAYEQGALLAINPDAHRLDGLKHLEYGIAVARKAALPPQALINSFSLENIEKLFTRKQKGQ